jgi:hypothetical protein
MASVVDNSTFYHSRSDTFLDVYWTQVCDCSCISSSSGLDKFCARCVENIWMDWASSALSNHCS